MGPQHQGLGAEWPIRLAQCGARLELARVGCQVQWGEALVIGVAQRRTALDQQAHLWMHGLC